MTKRKGLIGMLPPPTGDRAREVFDYDSASGVLRWRISPKRSKVKAGETAGSPGKRGYLVLWLDGRRCYTHHIVWLYVTGEWPKELDHRNLCKTDNRFENLRLATRGQNIANHPLRKNNVCGLKGVRSWSGHGRYQGRIQKDGKERSLGYFDTALAAHEAYKKAAKELFGEFARTA